MEYQFHEVADVFPLMSDAEFAALVTDIEEHGQIEMIWTYNGAIIDGRNRYRACQKLGIEPRTIEWNGEEDELLQFIVSLNLHRRHLNESQRAFVSSKLANLENGQRASSIDEAITQKDAAKLLNVSKTSVERAAKVQRKGIPELAEQIPLPFDERIVGLD